MAIKYDSHCLPTLLPERVKKCQHSHLESTHDIIISIVILLTPNTLFVRQGSSKVCAFVAMLTACVGAFELQSENSLAMLLYCLDPRAEHRNQDLLLTRISEFIYICVLTFVMP